MRVRKGSGGFGPFIYTKAASHACLAWAVDSFGESQDCLPGPRWTKENRFSGSQRTALLRGEIRIPAVVQTAPGGCRTVPTGCERLSYDQMTEQCLPIPSSFTIISGSLCSGCSELGRWLASYSRDATREGICGKSVPRTEDHLSQSLRCDGSPPLSLSLLPQHRRASYDTVQSEHGDTSSGARLPPIPVRPF